MTPTVTVTIRMPPDLAQALKELAEREERSLSGQIIVMLKAQVAGNCGHPSHPIPCPYEHK